MCAFVLCRWIGRYADLFAKNRPERQQINQAINIYVYDGHEDLAAMELSSPMGPTCMGRGKQLEAGGNTRGR